MRKILFVFGLFLCFLFGVSVETNFACFNASPSDNITNIRGYNFFVRDYNRTEAIFSGKVIEIDQFKVKFSVDKIWKGDIQSEFVMSSGPVPTEKEKNGLMSDCDYRFERGKSYLVYAQKHFVSDMSSFFENRYGKILPEYENLLWASKSSRTRPLDKADLGIRNLNKLVSPKKIKH